MSENKEPNPQCEMGDCVKYDNFKAPKIDSLINISLNTDDSLKEESVLLPTNEATQFLNGDENTITTNLILDNLYTIAPVNNQMDEGDDLEVGNLTFKKEDCIFIVDTSVKQWYEEKDLKLVSSVNQIPKTALANTNQTSFPDNKENVFNGWATLSFGTVSETNVGPTKNVNARLVHGSRYPSSNFTHPNIPVQLTQPQCYGTETTLKNTIHSSTSELKAAISFDNPTNISSVSSSSVDFDRSIDNLDSLNNKSLPKCNSDASMTANQAATIEPLNHALSPNTKEKHNENERKRRKRIKDSCDSLRTLIPELKFKTDRATLLEYTVQYLVNFKQATGLQFDKEFAERYLKD